MAGWYTGIGARGYVYRLMNHGERQYSDGKGNHISGLEGFWGYLKRKFASKGEFVDRNYLSILVNTSGDTIIDRIRKG